MNDYLADKVNVAKGRKTLRELKVFRDDLPPKVYGGVGHAGIWHQCCAITNNGREVRSRRTMDQVIADLNNWSTNSVVLP